MQRFSLVTLTFAALSIAGCEVSVFGSEPVSVFGGGTPTSGGNEGRCGEPEEMRVARVQLNAQRQADGTIEGESPCAYTCVIEGGALTTTEGCPILTRADDGTFTIDMARADALILRGEFCEASTLQLGDTAHANADGSDDATSSHDASVFIEGGMLRITPAHGSALTSSRIEGFANECTTRTIEVMDSVVYLSDLERGLCGTSMLRIDPPTDEQGAPDSHWHLSVGRALTEAPTDEAAHAPSRLELCFL